MLLNSHKAGREYCHLLKQQYSWQQTAWLEQSLTSMSSFTCSCWSLSSPKASMIKPEERCNSLLEEHEKKTKTCVVFNLNADNEKQFHVPWMMASRMTMTKKKKVMSNRMRQSSYGSPAGSSNSSPIPPPALTPTYMWNIQHYRGAETGIKGSYTSFSVGWEV